MKPFFSLFLVNTNWENNNDNLFHAKNECNRFQSAPKKPPSKQKDNDIIYLL